MSNGVRAAIAGVGAYVPQRVLSNSDREQMVDTSDEWITKRTGGKPRRIAAEADEKHTGNVGMRRHVGERTQRHRHVAGPATAPLGVRHRLDLGEGTADVLDDCVDTAH